MSTFKIGVIQLDCQDNRTENLSKAERFIDIAASNGAKNDCATRERQLYRQ